MKRFFLYVLLVPIVGTLVTMAYQLVVETAYELIRFGAVSLGALGQLRFISLVVWSAYIHWLIPALAIAVADRFIPSRGWPRIGMISAVGYVASLATIGLFWRWRWQYILVALIGATTAAICCWLLDELQSDRLRGIPRAILKSVRTLTKWPNGA